jgi:hypothetical protein
VPWKNRRALGAQDTAAGAGPWGQSLPFGPASVVVHPRVTQIVNGMRGVHAVLLQDAIRI